MTTQFAVEPAVGMFPEAWLEVSQRPRLDDRVPQDVRDYFAIARGSMAYGVFSLPCLHFAGGQVLRAAECAVRHRCRQVGITEDRLSLETRLSLLKERAALRPERLPEWTEVRRLRNTIAHRVRVAFDSPPVYLQRAEVVAELITDLFSAQAALSREPAEYERTAENWLEPNKNFVWLAGPSWENRIASVKIATTVPVPIRELFTQARDALRFGQFFYALCGLVGEMFHHLAVAAIQLRCAEFLGDRQARKMQVGDHLRILRERKILDDRRREGLAQVVELRNLASHPDFQCQVPPTWHFRMLELLAEDLNELFRDDCAT